MIGCLFDLISPYDLPQYALTHVEQTHNIEQLENQLPGLCLRLSVVDGSFAPG